MTHPPRFPRTTPPQSRDGESTQAFDPRPGVQMAQSASDYPIVDLYQLRCGEGCRTAKYFKFDS